MAFQRSDVEVIGRDRLHEGYFRIDGYRLRHRTFGGGWSATLNREVFERGSAAAVLPYDPVRDEVVLIEQFRPGPFAAGDAEPWLLEVVAGILDDGETPEGVARREAREEAGLTLGALEPIGAVYASPGASTELIHMFIGRIEGRAADGLHGLVEEGEDIRVTVKPVSEVFEDLWAGRIRNCPGFAAIAWLAARHDELRQRWLSRTST